MSAHAVRPSAARGPSTLVRHTGRCLVVLAGLVLGGSALLTPTTASAAQGPVGLGTADSFAVLAGTGITNTGPTTITGDVGTFPTSSESGFGTVTLSGTNHGADAVAQGAKTDLVAAYNDAAGRTPFTSLPVELGGSTLLPGVYRGGTFGLSSTLTLDAQGDPNAQFIFQAGSTVIAETAGRVALINGADPCHVVWQVGSSATFKVGSHFVGNVLALTSIAAETSATFQGRLLARNGAVTMDSNTITRANCLVAASSSPSASASPSPSASASSSAAPATPRATPSASTVPLAVPGPPTGTPGGAPPLSTPSAGLPLTGVPSLGLLSAGLGLVAAGTLAVLAGRRRRSGEPTEA